MARKSGLKTTYYARFLLLIVLPILLVVSIGTLVMVRQQLLQTGETIESIHQSVASTLEDEVEKASLGLAYFLMGSDQEQLSLLETLPATQAQRYDVNRRLQRTFDYFAFQDESIEALHLYLTDGSCYELGAQLALNVSEVLEQPCVRVATEQPNRVTLGSVPPQLLHYDTTHHGEVLLCAAMSAQEPRRQTALAAACLYFTTAAEEMLRDYNDALPAVQSFLTEGDRVLTGSGQPAQAAGLCLETAGASMMEYDEYRLTHIPHTDLAVLTLVDQHGWLSSYYASLGLILLAILLIMALFTLFTRLFFRGIIRPIDDLRTGMAHLQAGDFSHRLTPSGHRELQTLETHFNETADRMERLITENQAREQEKYQEELKALQSEINPHFLLNTINTIRFMAEMAHYDSIRDMAASLMEILRCILRNPSQRYTLETELKLLRSYVAIMDIRRPGGFTVDYDIVPESEGCRVPKLLLQPLVENAIQHAFPDAEVPGEITVKSRVEEGRLILTVNDNGVGIPQEKLQAFRRGGAAAAQSIGMANVKRRLELNCEDGHGMDVQSAAGEGTCITLMLPARYLAQEEDE